VCDGDEFVVDDEKIFAHKLLRIKVNSIQGHETVSSLFLHYSVHECDVSTLQLPCTLPVMDLLSSHAFVQFLNICFLFVFCFFCATILHSLIIIIIILTSIILSF
jgi:hypothetical protein